MKTANGKKMKSERCDDKEKLSDLPDEILLHIMSFMKIKDAVQTCILSKRWRDLWKSLPNLTLHTSDFSNPSLFPKFVSRIVSCRGNNPVHTLDFYRHSYMCPQILNRLMTYAVFHTIQQLRINVPYRLGLPPCVFSSRSLTSLHIAASHYCGDNSRTRIPESLELPALMSLHLEYVSISGNSDGYAEPFSVCNKLKTLYIDHCVVLSPNSKVLDRTTFLNITNASLASLAIDYIYMNYKAVIYTPNLTSFTLNGSPFKTLRGQEGMKVEVQSSSLV